MSSDPTAKPAPAKPPAKPKEGRRFFLLTLVGSWMAIGFTSLTAAIAGMLAGTNRFLVPNVLSEPPSKFKVGFPSSFSPGQVETKFIPQYGVWVVNYEYNGKSEIYALRSVCTHLGCTPNWLEGEQKFKCPCHGSGYTSEGINFEGPAPRPMDRARIELDPSGQIVVDTSILYEWPKGERTEFDDPGSFIQV